MHLSTLDKEKIISILKSEIPELLAVYIFGSYAEGSALEKSDIDIAYLSKSSLSSLKQWEISQKLAIEFYNDVDLIDLADANTVFKYQIISTGERIYGGGYEVESFETLAYSFYLRFKEERRPIVDEIMKNQSVLGEGNA